MQILLWAFPTHKRWGTEFLLCFDDCCKRPRMFVEKCFRRSLEIVSVSTLLKVKIKQNLLMFHFQVCSWLDLEHKIFWEFNHIQGNFLLNRGETLVFLFSLLEGFFRLPSQSFWCWWKYWHSYSRFWPLNCGFINVHVFLVFGFVLFRQCFLNCVSRQVSMSLKFSRVPCWFHFEKFILATRKYWWLFRYTYFYKNSKSLCNTGRTTSHENNYTRTWHNKATFPFWWMCFESFLCLLPKLLLKSCYASAKIVVRVYLVKL